MTEHGRSVTRPLRAGIIGCGVAAQSMHLPILSGLGDSFRIVAVCDLDTQRVAAVAKRFGGESYSNTDAMLARDDLDVVLVLASGNHYPLALAALERGCHVLVEKPLCFRVREANALVAEAQRRGLVLMVGYTRWFEAAYQRLQELLETSLEPPLLARILTVQTPESLYLQHHRMVSWDSEAGIAVRVDERARDLGDELEGIPVEGRAFYLDMLLDNSIHDLSVIRGLLGGPPRLEAAALDPSRAAFHVSWRFPGEIRCEYDFVLADRAGGRYEQRVELIGDAYRAVLSYPSPYVRYASARLTVERVDEANRGAEESSWSGGPSDAVERELLHFEASVRNGEPVTASGSEGTIDLALLQEVTRLLWGAHGAEKKNGA